MKDSEYRWITTYPKDMQCSTDVKRLVFFFFNLLQNGSSNLYQVFSHTNVAVCILELTADVRHQDICTYHMHKKCSHETHTNGIIQNFNSAKKIMKRMFSEYTQSSKPPYCSLIFSPCVTPVNTTTLQEKLYLHFPIT